MQPAREVDDGLVDHGIVHSVLRGDALHQAINTFDVGRSGKQGARRCIGDRGTARRKIIECLT